MSMTRQHYEFIGAALASAPVTNDAVRAVAAHFADEVRKKSAGFDKERFVQSVMQKRSKHVPHQEQASATG